MDHTEKNPTYNIKNSATFKMATIAFLALVLLIPASLIESLINERLLRRNSVIDEINDKWGNIQTIAGPIITIPYQKYIKTDNGSQTLRSNF
ncbi:MAG: inner membrane CreD family protein [Desulfobacterales bacterium]|nr:inner membrane CreD family protein [Desulfobacterales bacterium]